MPTHSGAERVAAEMANHDDRAQEEHDGLQGVGGGEATYTIMNHSFRVDARYSNLKAIGTGSYGIVCSAADQRHGKRVAIKKIQPMAQHAVDAKHVLREIRLMRYLGVHPNIISLEDVFVREFQDELYIVMELLDSDLHRIIQSPQALTDAHHRYFMYQLLCGVRFLHANRIIHRDLKPGNLLVTKSCQLRITDFGLARLRPMGRGEDPDDEVDDPMTEHVVTRWYRPPELMLCPDGLYGYAVDLWSVGCIFAELLGRQPLFPGRNFVDQLSLIFDVVGSPEPHEVAHIRNSQARKFLDSIVDRSKVPYAELFPNASAPAIDLLEGLLVFDPPQRLTVAEALAHPYFEPLRGSEGREDPLVAEGFEFYFGSDPLSRLQLKQLILAEVESFQHVQQQQHEQQQQQQQQQEAEEFNHGNAHGWREGAPSQASSASSSRSRSATGTSNSNRSSSMSAHASQHRAQRQSRSAAAAAVSNGGAGGDAAPMAAAAAAAAEASTV